MSRQRSLQHQAVREGGGVGELGRGGLRQNVITYNNPHDRRPNCADLYHPVFYVCSGDFDATVSAVTICPGGTQKVLHRRPSMR